MLVSSNNFTHGAVQLCTHVSLEPGSSLFYLRQNGLFYDGATQPCCSVVSKGRRSFYLLLAGELASSSGLSLEEPALLRMREDVLEGANGARPVTLRISGQPHVSLVLHVPRERVAGACEERPERLAFSPALEAAARNYAQQIEAREAATALASARARLLAQFSEEGLLLPDDHAPLPRGQRYGERNWNALGLYFARLDTAPTLAVLADLTRMSPRTTDRLMKQFTHSYGLPDEGLRDLAKRWRLKLATLLLSSPELSVRAVAQKVGYTNAEALANALAAEGLPTPSQYRQG